jgi:putative inorganic carbon (HCO3(-)) transporter
MSPHRLSWGFAYDMPLAQIVAIPMLAGLLFTKERHSIPVVAESVLLTAFWSLAGLTTLSAWYPDEAWLTFTKFSKILLMTFVTICLVQDRTKLRYALLVAALSVGYYGLKGGIWSSLEGGTGGMVLGPTGSFIEDNNGLALALNMSLPILFYLGKEEQRKWLRGLLYATFVCTVLAVVFTYSRAGFLGLVVVLLMMLARSRRKFSTAALMGVVLLATLPFIPTRWFDRMNTIADYEKDRSSMSRIYAWKIGWQIALDSPITGGGFNVFGNDAIWAKYAPEFYFDIGKEATNRTPNAHSIYFLVLGEHGFIGFFLFVGLIVSTLVSLRRSRRAARAAPDGSWLVNYSYMMEASICGFLVTGTFQNLAYFDFFYFLVGTTVVLNRLSVMAFRESSPVATSLLIEGSRVAIVGSPALTVSSRIR